jgi:beta-glucosidase/6-phospho-beta-glucosidase/beta-galactosidase
MVVYENKIVSLSSAKFIGCAVISTLHTQHKKTEDNTILNDLGWEIYPIGIYNMAKIHNKCATIPIIITENGIADKDDRNRGSFIIAHLEQLGREINDGDKYHWVSTLVSIR